MADYDVTDKEKEEIKKRKIDFAVKKKNTSIFLICTTIIQIIVTFSIILAMFIATLIIVGRFAPLTEATAPQVMKPLMFIELIAGLILGFKAFTAIVRVIIKKFNLKGKIKDDVLARYEKIPKNK